MPRTPSQNRANAQGSIKLLRSMRQEWVPISLLETNPAGLAAGSRWSARVKGPDHRENANTTSCTQKGCQNCCQPVFDLTRTEADSTSKRAVLASLQDARISSTRVRGSFPLLPRNDPRLPATNPAGLDWSANGQTEPGPFSGRFRVRPHSRGNPGDITNCDILAQAQVFKAGPCLYRTWRPYGRQHPQQPARSCHERLCQKWANSIRHGLAALEVRPWAWLTSPLDLRSRMKASGGGNMTFSWTSWQSRRLRESHCKPVPRGVESSTEN